MLHDQQKVAIYHLRALKVWSTMIKMEGFSKEDMELARAIEASMKEVPRLGTVDDYLYDDNGGGTCVIRRREEKEAAKPEPMVVTEVEPKPILKNPSAGIPQRPPSPPPNPPRRGMKLVTVIKDGWVCKEWR